MADNNVIITFQFNAEGQSGVLSAVDAINERIKQGQEAQAQQAQAFSIANIAPTGPSELWLPPALIPANSPVSHESTTEEKHINVEASASGHKEVEELGKGAEIASKSFEVLKRGIEGVGQAMISGSLQASITGFQRFSSSVEEAGSVVGGFVGKLGLVGAIGASVTGALGGLAVLFNELASRMSENVLEFNELGKAAGLNNQQFANLEGAFARSGVGLEQLHQVVRVTTNRLQSEWGDIVRTVRDSADHYAEGTIKINEAHRNLTDSADLPVEAEMKIAKSRRAVVDAADKTVEAEMKIAKSRRDVADSSDLTTQAEMRIAKAERDEVDAATQPKQAQRKIETAELGARSAEDAVPGAIRTKEQTEFDLTKAQLQFRAKYLGEPVTPEDNQRLQLMQRRADASHIEALQAQAKEDERNIERAKMHRDEAEENEQQTRRNAIPESQENQERIREEARKEERNAIPEAVESQQQTRLDAARIGRDALPEAREAQEQARIDNERAERNAMPEAREAQERAAMEVRASEREQADDMRKDPAKLAEAIRAGGGGVNWREISAPDIFRSLAFMGGGTMMGTLSAAHQFMTMPGMQGQTETNQGVAGAVAQQFGLRGGIGPILDALTKGEFNKLTPETEKTAKDMGGENLKSAEEIRDAWVKTGEEIRNAVIETVKNSHLDTFSVKSAGGMGDVISSLPGAAKAAFDSAAASANTLSRALDTAAISVDKAFSPGVRQAIQEDKPLQDLYAKLPPLQQEREDITGEMRAKGLTPGAVLTEPQQKQADVLQGRLDAVVGQIKEIEQAARPHEVEAVKQQGGTLLENSPSADLKGAATELKEAAGALKESATPRVEAPSGEGHSTGGYISGPGTGTSDSIRAPWLSNGEYVIKADTVAKVGVDKLDALNQGHIGFADGGFVNAGHGDCPDPEMSPRTMAYIKGRPSYAEGDVQPSSGIIPDAKIAEHPPTPSTMVPQDAVNLWDHPRYKSDSFADGGLVGDTAFDPYSPRNKAELKPYTPSWSERIRSTVQDTMAALGASKTFSQDFGHNVQDVAGLVPVVGQVLAGNEAVRDYRSGNYLGAALNAAGALPLPGTGALHAAEKGVAQEVEKGIVAYHGSPHDFDKFSTEHIGEGEGAQAYGHGLYFAENEGVAKSYRDQLSPNIWGNSGGKDVYLGGNKLDKSWPGWGRPEGDAVSSLNDPLLGDTFQGKAAGLRSAGMHDAAKWLEDNSHQLEARSNGHMYQVRINAEPEHFLDWDKPLSEQHPKVQGALGNIPGVIPSSSDAAALHYGYDPAEFAAFSADRKEQLIAKTPPSALEELMRSKSGADIGRGVDASALHEAGVPGIKYLDQGSRVTSGGELVGVEQTPKGWQAKVKVSNRGGIGFSAPTDMFTTSKPYATEAEARRWADEKINTGSRNYVVFDDKLVNIENKYALGGLVGYAHGGLASSGLTTASLGETSAPSGAALGAGSLGGLLGSGAASYTSDDSSYIRRKGYAEGGQVTDDAGAVIDDVSTIMVPHETRTDEQIRANYRENLDVQLLASRISEADRENKERKIEAAIAKKDVRHVDTQDLKSERTGATYWDHPVAKGKDGLLHTTTLKHDFPGYPLWEGTTGQGDGRQWIAHDGEWYEQQGGRPHPRAGAPHVKEAERREQQADRSHPRTVSQHAKDNRYQSHDSGLELSGVTGEVKRKLPEEIEEERSASPITPYEHSAGGFRTLTEAIGRAKDTGVASYAERSQVPDDERRFFGTGPSTDEQQKRQEYNRLGLTSEQQEKQEHLRLGLPDDKEHEEYRRQHPTIDRQHQEEYERLGLTLEQQEKKERERLGFAIGGLVPSWMDDDYRRCGGAPNYGIRSGIMGPRADGSYSWGGLIKGPGTSTSDSISAPWVSNGEYVINAARVAQVGVDNMHAFNEGRLGFANGGSMFAEGGMIGNAGFSSGSLVSSSSSNSGSGFSGHYTLDVTTDKGIVPTMVTEDMMSALSQSAMGSKLTRAGVNPSWRS